MWIHQAGQDRAAARVQPGFIGIGLQQFRACPHSLDGFIMEQYGAIFKDAQTA